MMTPYEIVHEDLHCRMISVKLLIKHIEEDMKDGKSLDVIRHVDAIRDILQMTGFERQIYESVQEHDNKPISENMINTSNVFPSC